MALTPKRLFLSLSASLSLSPPLTLSSHAHLWSLKLSLKMRVRSNELFSTLKNYVHHQIALQLFSTMCEASHLCRFTLVVGRFDKGVLCTAYKKKGGGSARFHHSASCASKWRRPNLREAGRTTGNPMQCYAGERLGVAFCVL